MPCKTPRLTGYESHISSVLALARLTLPPDDGGSDGKIINWFKDPLRRRFSAWRENQAPREKLPARSLLGGKKFPASPLSEFAANDL
jgi:hypothetical protein